MRPTPEEVIAGVRSILKTEVGPSVSAQVQPQLKRLMAVLRDARWNEAAFDLMRESEVFAGLAREAAMRVDGELAEMLAAAATFGTPRSFAEANETNRALRVALAHLIERIRDERLTALDDLCVTIGTALLRLRERP